MRSLIISLLVAGQLAVAAHPVLAAELDGGEQSRVGMFGGVQVRVPFGGQVRGQVPTASLAIAPVARTERIDGARRTRIGDGMRLSLTTDRRAELSLAGTRLDQLGLVPAGQAPGGRRAGVSTLGWVAIGAGTVAVLLLGFGYWVHENSECGPGEC